MNFSRPCWRRLGVLAWALAVAGCSATPSKQSQVDHGSTGSSGLHLSPSPAFAASRIDAVFDSPWIDPVKCQFVWKRNGVVIEGAQGNSLDASRFSRGERVSVEVISPASANANARDLTAAVDVVNTPPKITGVTLVMVAPSGTAVIQANVQSTDPDRDNISYDYRWFKNDGSDVIGNGPSLPVESLSRGDRVAVEVVAHDGQSSSPPFRSEALTIDNRPPQFTSQPQALRATDAVFRYQAVAVDRDGDPLRYELVSAPSGMTIDPSGMIVWPLPARDQRQGEHPVRIKVTDSRGGQAVQEFSVQLSPAGK